jgi:hypothetical protein
MGSFGEVEDITQDEFRRRTGDYLNLTDTTYTLIGQTNKGKIPVGMFSGKFNGPMLFIGSAIWFKWASSRNKIETAVHALNELRKEYIVLLHSNMKDKEFYVNIAKHGVIRRVGTVYDVYDDGPAALFQTRKR